MKGFAVLQGCIEQQVVSYNANGFGGGSGLHAGGKQRKRRGYHGIGRAEGAVLEEGIPLPPQYPDTVQAFLGQILLSLLFRIHHAGGGQEDR